MTSFPWLSLIVFFPLIGAVLCFLVKAESSRWLALGFTVGNFFLSLPLWWLFDSSTATMQFVERASWISSPPINYSLGMDGISFPLVLMTTFLMPFCVTVSWTAIEKSVPLFMSMLLIMESAMVGVFVALDFVLFYVFWEVMLIPMYLLIGIWGSSHKVTEAGPLRFVWKWFDIGGREYAAMKLTLMLLVGSAFILVGLLALYFSSGAGTFDMAVLAKAHYPKSLQIWTFVMFWLGFGSLAGVFPFHTWSPDGHASAPTAVSMLHAGVLMKLGAFGVMRIGMMMLPDGAQFWAPIVGGVAVVNVVYGAMSALSQKDLKYIIAYSSVSHMGVVMLGAATLTQSGWNGAVYQMFAHGIMTGLFFALVGHIYERAHSREVAKMGGFATVMPGVAAFFTLAGLSSLGLPGTAGFVAEFLVFAGGWQSPRPWWSICGVIGAFVTAVYVLRVSRAVFFGDGPSDHFHDLRDVRKIEWAPLWILGGTLLLCGIWPRLLLDFIDPTTTNYLRMALGSVLPVGVLP